MRIAIANDLPMAVEVLRRVIVSGGHDVAWVALNGAEATERCAHDVPDLILMDLIMPVMDGVQATAAIMQRSPCAILIVTASVSGATAKVFEAMGYGALDAVGTPILEPCGDVAGCRSLLDKIAVIGKLMGADRAAVSMSEQPLPVKSTRAPLLIALASSTGGPKALAHILSSLPYREDVAVGVIQHLDVQFAKGLAEWLSEQSHYPVVLAREGMCVEGGAAFLAATNDHLVVAGDITLRYTRDPADNPYRPSADAFFASLREHWPRPGLAAVLTGMGQDGAAGLLILRRAGWHTIAQDESTSVIYGMPRAAARVGAATEILPLPEIAPAITRHFGEERSSYARG